MKIYEDTWEGAIGITGASVGGSDEEDLGGD